MKIRWNQSSLRLRITPSELSALQRGEAVREALLLPGIETSGWRVVITTSEGETSLRQNGCLMQVSLSQHDLGFLSDPEREGVYFTSEHADRRIAYYIEKDYPCAHPRAAEVQVLSKAEGYIEENFAAPAGFNERKTAAVA